MTAQQLVLSLVLATMVFSVALELRVDDFRRVAQAPLDWPSIKSIMEVAVKQFRLPRWENQEHYVELWVDVVLDCADTGELPRIGRDEARVRVHAMFGLLNSSPMLPPFPAAALRALLAAMARAALGVRLVD